MRELSGDALPCGRSVGSRVVAEGARGAESRATKVRRGVGVGVRHPWRVLLQPPLIFCFVAAVAVEKPSLLHVAVMSSHV